VTPARELTEHATCLGCGCACDDITVVVQGNTITEAINACSLGRVWFGDGKVPAEVRSGGRAVPLERAIGDAATLLAAARRPLVYLAPEITSEAQRAAVAIADRLGAALDSPTSEIAAGILAAQRRGRAGATLGEIRQRADLIVFWGVDPSVRYPRYTSRYAVEPVGIQAPDGRKSRTVVAVDVGPCRGPDSADERVALAPGEEVDALGAMRAAVLGRATGDPSLVRVEELARRMARGRYTVIVHDAEPSELAPDADRSEALVALTQALNGPSRCALSPLRAGGNRSGADLVVTWQTGFPMAVDFAPGYPCYRPRDGAAGWLRRREIDAALLVGAAAQLPAAVADGLAAVSAVVIGPGASAVPFKPAVAVDTGVAGIHENGTAFRMDDVPLPLRAALHGVTPPLTAVTVVHTLGERLAGR
jgi:formylmethanofuran dehydrogenase subunit B